MSFQIDVLTPDCAETRRAGKDLSPSCPMCKAAASEFIGFLSKTSYYGRSSSGKRFTVIIRERWKCGSCSQHWIERYGVYDPDEWREGNGYK